MRIVQLAHAVGECILRRAGWRRTDLKLLWRGLVYNCDCSCIGSYLFADCWCTLCTKPFIDASIL